MLLIVKYLVSNSIRQGGLSEKTPYRMQEEDFDKLGTTLSEALKYIKYSKDKVSLQKKIRE